MKTGVGMMGGASTGRLTVVTKKTKKTATPGPGEYQDVSVNLLKKKDPGFSIRGKYWNQTAVY